ncbi:MAG: glycosyltransferase family 9 protein [Bacteroidales bacterium]|nr:glycosyltransferase family 9 protein [Bacteroidales bacterium]
MHFLTKKEFLPLIRVNPFIDKIHILDGNMHALLQSLKVEQFDYILDLHKNLRSLRVRSSMKIMSFTVDKINLAKFLMIRFKVNRLPDKHIVDRYMETTRLFDVTNDGKGLDYFIPPEDEIELSSLPQTFRSGYIALVVGAMHGTKQMPEEKMINICRELDLPVILLGGQREGVLGKEIDKQTGDQVLNTCGQYNINQSASLIRQSRVVITHDTGLMHIAAAFHKKILSVWGHTIPEFGMYPYLPDRASKIFEVVGLPCRPCTKIGKKKCPKGHFRCMNDIDHKEIISTVKKIY